MRKTVILTICAALIFALGGCAGEQAVIEPETGGSQPAIAAPEPALPVQQPAALQLDEDDDDDDPLPDNSWEFDSPENRGVDSEMLARFHEALAGVDIRCALIVKDGVIISEYYKTNNDDGESYDENTVFRMASVTKSVSGAVIGLAADRGLLEVDAKLTEFYAELAEPGQEDKGEITVAHLLTHTSGIYWNEWAGGDYFMRLSRSENWVDFVFSQHMSYAPGTVFNYTTGGSHLLGGVLRAATGVSAFDFAKEHLFGPLGMDSVRWRTDPQGFTDAGNGIEMTARDAAKLGQLYLDKGNWRGRQIISEDWVERSTSRQAAGSPGTGEHGYCWWLRDFGGYRGFYAMGHGGQYIIVVPELNLVTVMASRLSDTYLPQRIFTEYVIPACGQGE
ncbi:MAG: beta-lactamase family protein [Oscillospiraceae bacterium]|nr:beta-lactamase family protein [Oscillospiraceae bacterium]